MRDLPQTMAMQQLQGSGRDVPTEVNLRRAAKIIAGDLLRRLRNTDLIDDPARLEAADRIEALEADLAEAERVVDAFGRVSPQQYQKELAAKSARIEALEAALREITFAFEATENAAEKMYFIAAEALAPEQDK